MGRLIFLLALIIAAVLLWRGLRNHIKRAQPLGKLKTTTMVRCDYCGVHVPREDLVRSAGGGYCSQEHRALDRPDD